MTRRIKLVVFVPEEAAEAVRTAMCDAGAGTIGAYSHCTFTTTGVGRFKPEEGAHPQAGESGKINAVEECKIESVCERDHVEQIVAAIEAVHPYEEVAIDVYPIEEY